MRGVSVIESSAYPSIWNPLLCAAVWAQCRLGPKCVSVGTGFVGPRFGAKMCLSWNRLLWPIFLVKMLEITFTNV